MSMYVRLTTKKDRKSSDAMDNCPRDVRLPQNAKSSGQTDEKWCPFMWYETTKNMKLTFSHQISADLYRRFVGEVAIFDNLWKEKSFAQDLQDRQVLSAFEKRELNINLSPCFASDHCARLGTRAGMFQADSWFDTRQRIGSTPAIINFVRSAATKCHVRSVRIIPCRPKR